MTFSPRRACGKMDAGTGRDPGRAAMELLVFLPGWLIHHILAEDKRYGPFLKDRGVY